MNNKNLHFKNEVKKIMNYFNVAKYDVAIQKSKVLLKKNPEFSNIIISLLHLTVLLLVDEYQNYKFQNYKSTWTCLHVLDE